MASKEAKPGSQINLAPPMNPDAATDLIRLFSNKQVSAIYFDSEAAFEQDVHTWKLIAIVAGHETTLYRTSKGPRQCTYIPS